MKEPVRAAPRGMAARADQVAPGLRSQAALAWTHAEKARKGARMG
jgi:hypothetical protein